MDTLLELATNCSGVTCHSAEVGPGKIFVAIRGRQTDGNRYVAEAFQRGAAAIVTDSPEPFNEVTLPIISVPDARQAYALLAAQHYGHPSRDLHLIGVTGSNGKTTITYMLEHILSYAGVKTGLIGTVKVNTGRRTLASTLTTPDAAKVQSFLAEMRDNGVTHAAMEVSAQGIEMRRVDEVAFSCGILTNICPDHLDFHKDFASYIAAKEQFLPLLSEETPLIVNINDHQCRAMAAKSTGPILSAAVCPADQPALFSVSLSQLTSFTSRFMLHLNGPVTTVTGSEISPCSLPITLPLPGLHNVENALLASAAALIHDIPPQLIAKALSSFAGVERRFNIHRLSGITFIDDTALNPGSINAVFETLRAFRYRRLIAVNAIRGNRGAAINAANAETLAAWQRRLDAKLLITASADRTGASDRVTSAEQDAFLHTLTSRHSPYTYSVTLAETIQEALSLAKPGDLIALLGAQGMDDGWQLVKTNLTSTSYEDVVISLPIYANV